MADRLRGESLISGSSGAYTNMAAINSQNKQSAFLAAEYKCSPSHTRLPPSPHGHSLHRHGQGHPMSLPLFPLLGLSRSYPRSC